MSTSEPRTIAVFVPNWVGDAVMATPAMRAIRQRFSAAEIIAVLRPYVAPILDGTQLVDRRLFLTASGPRTHRWQAVATRLRQEAVDLAVLFPNSFRSAMVAWFGRCRRSVGYARSLRSWMLTDRLPSKLGPKRDFVPCPIIDAYNALAVHIGCDPPGTRMELGTTPVDERAADQVWRAARWHAGHEIICFNPGAAFGSAKYWPIRYFAELARRFVDIRGSAILVLCGPSERGITREIVRLAGRPMVHSLAEHSPSIGLTKACIRRADLLVTTDSGPRHFAAAFDRPVVTLFGPTHIEWTETYHPKAVHLQKKVDCGPCQLRVCPLDHRCMELLTPADVFNAAAQLLDRGALAGNHWSHAG